MRPFVLLMTCLFLAAAGTLGVLGIIERPPARPQAQLAERGRGISPPELGRHASRADCWIAVRGGVYDVTRYIEQHPAPPQTITETCGTDATVAFETKHRNSKHSPRAWESLEAMRVGDYTP